MLNKLFFTILLSITTYFTTVPLYAQTSDSMFGFGINYPGIGVRYFPNKHLAIDAKFQFSENLIVPGLRGSIYFNPDNRVNFYAGFEYDYISYTGEVTIGTGYALSPYLGGELFLTKWLGIMFDFGPAIVSLYDSKTGYVMIPELDYVFNIGINLYIRTK
ncbi:MAG: hypothetical protein WC955_12995 [Elusimicrobiota bacterium]